MLQIAAQLRLAMTKRDLNEKSLGNDSLSSEANAAPQVPSALASLTSGFEMLAGVPVLRHEHKKSELILRWFFNPLVHC
ncbi:MAG: hypothetical protein ABFD05_05520 [Anaerolineaceae bacterium]